MQEELDRLRKQEAERRANHAAEVSLAFAQATAQPQQPTAFHNSAAAAEYQPEAPPQITEELLRTLKVSWDRPISGVGYTVDQLRNIMSVHGSVEHVSMKESKRKKKGSAFVVMQSLDAARAASEAVSGSLDNPLLVVPFAKAAAAAAPGPHSKDSRPEQRPSPEAYAPAQPSQQHQSHPAFPVNTPATTPTPPSSPVKVRNPFGDSPAVDQSAPAQHTAQMRMPAFGATFGASGPAFGVSAPSARPLFAAGVSRDSSAAGQLPAGPYGFSSGSCSSFPGAHGGPAALPQGFGQPSLGASVQAGVKWCAAVCPCAAMHRVTSLYKPMLHLRPDFKGRVLRWRLYIVWFTCCPDNSALRVLCSLAAIWSLQGA